MRTPIVIVIVSIFLIGSAAAYATGCKNFSDADARFKCLMTELGIAPPSPEKREDLQQYRDEVYNLVLKPCALRYVGWRATQWEAITNDLSQDLEMMIAVMPEKMFDLMLKLPGAVKGMPSDFRARMYYLGLRTCIRMAVEDQRR